MKFDDVEEEKIDEEEEKTLILHLNETSDIINLNNSIHIFKRLKIY